VLDANDFRSVGDQVVEHSTQIARTTANVKNLGARMKIGEEMLCGIRVL
jgi:hypothetical protein